MSEIEIFPTVSWSAGAGCHGGCGQMVHVKDGKMVKIEGDDNHPWAQGRSCPRVLALTQYMYHEERITQPLKRIGKRGQGNFQPISWDEAFDICETRLRDIRENHGAESVLFCQGTGRDIGGPLSFLAYSYGSPNWAQLGLSGHSCFTPRLGAMKATIGDNAVVDCAQFSVERYDDPEWQTPEVILVWGQNPPATCPDAFYGHWIVDCMQLGSKIVSIDPRHTWLSSRSEHHLQIRPGTDGALALGMLNVIISEEIYDHEFVENWVSGFEELKERVAAYPVDKVAQITHLPADEIEATARLFAKAKRAAIQWGVSIDMCADATAVAHAIIALWTITGNIDIPGGQVIARPSHGVITYPYNSEDLIELYGLEMVKRLSEKRIGADRYKMFKNFRGFAHPDMAIEQVVTGDPYPIKGAWIQTANIIGGQSFNSRYHYDALKKLDFIAVVDLFHNPTSMALADIVLPAATFPEKNSIRSWWAPLQIIKQRVQIGECKSDWEINFELAKRFNRDGLKKYQKLEDLFDERLAAGGTTFAEMDQKGGWEMPPEGPEKPYRRHERGLLRVDGKPGFNTGSGKVELYSLTFESWGLDPLPFYTEPPQSHISTPELFEEYPLILITGARSSLFFHSEHRQIPWLREKEPDPYVEIHPDTAAAYGIYDGEWIYIQNDQGKVKRKAALTLEVKPEHIHTLHGWWMPEEEGPEPHLYGVWDYQVNQLVPGPQASKSGFGGGQYRTTLVTLAKIPEPEHTEH